MEKNVKKIQFSFLSLPDTEFFKTFQAIHLKFFKICKENFMEECQYLNFR